MTMSRDSGEPWADAKYCDLTRMALARLLEISPEELHLIMPGATRSHVQAAIIRAMAAEGANSFLSILGHYVGEMWKVESGLRRCREDLKELQKGFYGR